MVNVPGRSKGCNTCRKRKIACSQQRPACSQCLKSGRTCLGYSRQTIFVNSVVSPEPHETQKPGNNDAAKTCSTEVTKSTAVEQTKKPDNLKDSLLELAKAQVVYHKSDAIWSLCNTSARSQLLGAEMHESANEPNIRMWMTLMPQIQYPTKALETAAYAVAAARIGGRFDDQNLIQESLKLYTQGLRRLQQALWDPQLMYHDETLGACMFLAVYEILQCPSKTRVAFIAHHNGCAKLVKLRGPMAHSKGFGHIVFLGFRFMDTLRALETKTTFLSEPEWRTVPFSVYPKIALDKLLDLILYAPSILRDVDLMNTTPSPATQLRVAVNLLRSCLKLEEDLNCFYTELEGSMHKPMFWTVPSAESTSIKSNDQSGKDPLIFPLAFRFPDSRTAVTLIMYWAIKTMLWSGMCHMYRVTSQLTTLSPTDGGELEGYFAPSEEGNREAFRILIPSRCKDFPEMAQYVCQSVEYFFRDVADSAGITGPLQMVKESLGGFPGQFDREIAWLQSKLEQVERRGVKIVRYLDTE